MFQFPRRSPASVPIPADSTCLKIASPVDSLRIKTSTSTSAPTSRTTSTSQTTTKMSQVPRGLRACLVCSFVQAANKWNKSGCPNCEDFLELRNSSDAIGDCTSEVFEGLVTVNDTSTGWVSRWLRIQGYVPGVYATKVNGLVS